MKLAILTSILMFNSLKTNKMKKSFFVFMACASVIGCARYNLLNTTPYWVVLDKRFNKKSEEAQYYARSRDRLYHDTGYYYGNFFSKNIKKCIRDTMFITFDSTDSNFLRWRKIIVK